MSLADGAAWEREHPVVPAVQSQQQVTEAFLHELRELLKKYGAELEAADHYQGYPECGEDVRMTVTVPAIYDDTGNTKREWTEIDLGRRVAQQ